MARTVKPAGQTARSLGRKHHGSPEEARLLGGLGALIKWDASKVKVTGEAPGKAKGNQSPRSKPRIR